MNEDEMMQQEMLQREAELRASEERTRNIQSDAMMQTQDKSMIQEQLDLGEELERIDYLLRGYTIDKDQETGDTIWIKPVDEEMVILSDYGVHLVRNTIAWYLNKNTLLSNYDEATIRTKMEDFASDLNDTIFMEYEKVFKNPSFEDCKDLLDKRIADKTKIRVYASQILGKKLSQEEQDAIKDKIIKQIEPIVERELEKIKQQIIKNKLKRFMILIREIQDAVHSTYNRAYAGQERKSLRQHMHISETKGGMQIQPPRKSGFLDHFRRG